MRTSPRTRARIVHYDLPIDKHPDGEAVRKKHNHYVTGRDGGRDIDLRKFASKGLQLHGRSLYVLGLRWLYTWGSGCFCGVAPDAEHLAQVIMGSIAQSAA